MLWSWKLEVLATPSSLRSLSQNFSEAAEAPPRRCPWAKIARYRRSLARATGPFPPTTAPRFWRQFLSQASTCPWAHIGRFKRYSLARGHLLFSPTEPSLSASSNANDICFMSVITLLRDSNSNTTSAMYTVNLNSWEVI